MNPVDLADRAVHRKTSHSSRQPTVVNRATRESSLPSERVPRSIDYGARRAATMDAESQLWARALDAAHDALESAGGFLPAPEVGRHQHALVTERADVRAILKRLADARGIQPSPWLSPVNVTPRMLGLGAEVKGCIFDVEGVLTDSGLLHAAAWAEAFDPFLLSLSERTGWHFIPFDRETDYRNYLDGRPRLEGVQAFLDSRGIHLPEQEREALARRKTDALARTLQRNGVTALVGARRYLEAAGQAGLGRAAVSSSATTLPMLQLAKLATLVDERVDADVIHTETLRSRPAPDILFAACRRLDIAPDEAAVFTHVPAGVAAGLGAGMSVIGVGEDETELLNGFGAEQTVPSLRSLLDQRLISDLARR
jgi:beta-phosphoglucomutase-like phosphatase (HAD superfamily)